MITIVIGTNRPDSKTKKISQQIGSLYSNLGQTVRLLDLATLPPELFHPSAYARKPDSFDYFSETIVYSAGLVIVTPEYNGGMPGILKYFIDMLPFSRKLRPSPGLFRRFGRRSVGRPSSGRASPANLWLSKCLHLSDRVFVPEVHRAVNSEGLITDPVQAQRAQGSSRRFS